MADYTRLEQYLDAIISGTGLIPDPVSREDYFLAKIAGADVQLPEPPYTRKETYLAYLAGADVIVPQPVAHLEFFLYAACGGVISLPVPVTREERYWSLYNTAGDEIRPDPETGGIIVPKGGAITSFVLTYTLTQHGTGDASAENIKPIDIYTDDIIYVSGSDISNPTEYAITWPDNHKYFGGGTVDVLTGAVTETHRAYDVSDWPDWTKGSGATYPYFYYAVVRIKTADTALCSHLMDKSNIKGDNQVIGMRVYNPSSSGSRLLLRPWIDTEATKETIKAWLQAQKLAGTPVQVGYKRNTEETYELDNVPRITLNDGVTRIWAQHGSISMTYIPGAPKTDIARTDEAILTE